MILFIHLFPINSKINSNQHIFGTAEGASLGIPDKEANAIKCFDEKQIGKLQISHLATIVAPLLWYNKPCYVNET